MIDQTLQLRAQYIEQIAQQAGDLAMRYFKQWSTLNIEQKKSPQDLVSEADRAVEAFIRSQILREFPKDNILGEEQDDVVNGGEYTWIIDPIDGTYAFLHGIPLWCVSVAVLYKGQPYLGVIVDPNHHEVYSAVKNGGAFCNGQPITAIKNANLQSGSVAFGIDKGVRAQIAEQFIHRSIEHQIHIARTYTCALNMAWVASGRIMAAFYPYVSSWDYCAGLILVEEAGGWHNDPLKDDGLHKGGALLATAKDVYDNLAEICQIEFLDNLEK
ncbi:MAG: inositol monophosphatase family protein [Alphaproteobacteria bacterium]